jgi:hypothetical protein
MKTKRIFGIMMLIVVVCAVMLTKAIPQTKDRPAAVAVTKDDKKPEPVVTPLTSDESYALTSAEQTIEQKSREIDDLNMKLAQAVIAREVAKQQWNAVAQKYPGQMFLKNPSGVYGSRRAPTAEDKR